MTGEVDSSDVHFISDCNLQMVDVTNETNSSDVWFISNYNGLTLVEVQNDNSKTFSMTQEIVLYHLRKMRQ